ncbi:helix-turn-helix domain-containing protein [Kiritimatiellota bacterium B12222]|nr:helix-turn-helix domain-containing protein [Kiritimatiellota bacterium B12222]
MKDSPNQSIARAIQILHAVAASPEGLTAQEMAELLQVSRPTAHNIATSLLNESFLIKHNKPVRYTIGPAPGRIAKGAQLQQRQLQAKELMQIHSRQHPGTGWVYAEAGDDDMRVIWRMDFKRPEVIDRVDREISHPYDAATALLFHAFADETKTEALRRRYPFPEFGLSIWKSREDFQQYLKKIRNEGYVNKPWSTHRELGAIAVPIFNQHHVLIGSIGAFFPINKFAKFSEDLLATVQASALTLGAHE